MNKYSWCVVSSVVVGVLTLTMPAVAQERSGRASMGMLGMREAVLTAVERHPSISGAKATVDRGHAELAMARAMRSPKMEYSVSPGYGGGYATSGSSAGMRATIGLSYVVYDFGLSEGQIAEAESTLSKREYLMADTAEGVAFEAASDYVEMAANQATLLQAQALLEAERSTREKIQARVQAGFSSSADLFEADMAIQRAETEIIRARTRFDIAAGRLSRWTGLSGDRVLPIAEIEAWLSTLAGEDDDIQNYPMVRAARAAVDAAQARMRQTEAQVYPSVSVAINRSHTLGQASASNSTWVGLIMSGSYSMGDFNAQRQAVALTEYQAAFEELRAQELGAATALQAARRKYAGAQSAVKASQGVSTLAQASRDMYWKEYTLDKRSLTDVLNVEREIYAADVEQINAQAESALARVKLLSTQGVFVAMMRDLETTRR